MKEYWWRLFLAIAITNSTLVIEIHTTLHMGGESQITFTFHDHMSSHTNWNTHIHTHTHTLHMHTHTHTLHTHTHTTHTHTHYTHTHTHTHTMHLEFMLQFISLFYPTARRVQYKWSLHKMDTVPSPPQASIRRLGVSWNIFKLQITKIATHPINLYNTFLRCH